MYDDHAPAARFVDCFYWVASLKARSNKSLTRNVAAAPTPQKPTPPKPTPQPAATGRTYTIKPGDNLWNIAKEVYGDGTKYQRILDANPGLNPDNMKPGTKITIP